MKRILILLLVGLCLGGCGRGKYFDGKNQNFRDFIKKILKSHIGEF